LTNFFRLYFFQVGFRGIQGPPRKKTNKSNENPNFKKKKKRKNLLTDDAVIIDLEPFSFVLFCFFSMGGFNLMYE